MDFLRPLVATFTGLVALVLVLGSIAGLVYIIANHFFWLFGILLVIGVIGICHAWGSEILEDIFEWY